MWSLESLEQYRDAWNVFNQPLAPGLTERRFTILNWQLQAIIKAAEDAALDVELIRRRRPSPWPIFVQRRAIVGGRRCAVYCCTRLSPDPTVPRHNFVLLKTPTTKWAEFQLFLVKDGPKEYVTYVVPRGAIQKQTTISLDNPAFQSYKSNWKLLAAPVEELDAITPIEWRPAPPHKEVPVVLAKTMLQAQSHGLSVEPVSTNKRGVCLSDKCLYISQKPCQIMQARTVIMGKTGGRYVSVNIPKTDWAEFLVFFVPPEIEGAAPTFYVVPRTRIIKPTTLSPTSSWL